ncbi:MAG TPA: 4-amino-4-deoxychorismate lyase [Bacteroidales bacterium]|nr:4-amino-4-deoxychorismate lyase [Bacteroidales bacterium]
MEQFLLHNGEFYPTGIPVIQADNRSFKFGDGVFESIRVYGENIMFLAEHLDRLKRACQVLQLDIPLAIGTVENLTEQIFKLLHRNRWFIGTKIRVTVYRKAGGLFAPEHSAAEWLIEAQNLEHGFYSMNSKGLIVGIYSDVRKVYNKLSFFKSSSSLLYVTAGLFQMQNRLDDVLLLNNHNFIVEGLSSNIFLVKGNFLLTPSLDQGCVEGIMRAQVIRIAEQNGFKVFDNCAIEPTDLVKSEEVFLTNSAGIRWVSGFEQKRFFNKTATFFLNELNKEVVKKP